MAEVVLKTLLGGHAAGWCEQLGGMSNRHGMIAGATGTGKTVTLQILAEGFSRMGVPVFAADIKGDLSGLANPGKASSKISERLQKIALNNYEPQACPTMFWDIFAKQGHPLRATISDMGPLLLSHLLELSDVQSGVLYAVFKIADDHGWLLLDLKDLTSLLSWVSEHSAELLSAYGNLSRQSIGAIQRSLLILQEQGAEAFFGEPALQLQDLMQTDAAGQGFIHLLDATQLLKTSPQLYSAAMLWLLSELFEQLPEVGDVDKPRLVFFFDEAHLLFNTASPALIDKLTQVVRLIRSKGVGIYFVTQSPNDIPEDILGQLGLRVQHALRAFTPKDRQAVRAIADNFRPNPAFDTEALVTEMGIGVALVSALDASGRPNQVEQVWIRPPESQIGPISAAERQERIQSSPLHSHYQQVIDRPSAFEHLQAQSLQASQQQKMASDDHEEKESVRSTNQSQRPNVLSSAAKSFAISVASSLGRELVRGLLGSLTGTPRRRRR